MAQTFTLTDKLGNPVFRLVTFANGITLSSLMERNKALILDEAWKNVTTEAIALPDPGALSLKII